MKRLSIACSLLFAASALFAQDAPVTATQPPADAAVPPPAIAASPAAPHESPLVAAARKSTRKGKKPAKVITNDTLSKSGGHITTGIKGLPPIPPEPPAPKYASTPPPSAEDTADAEKKKKAEEAERKKKADAADRAAASTYDESVDERYDDPAAAEHAMKQRPSEPPTKTQSQKPPQ
jgi:hypothetical protein